MQKLNISIDDVSPHPLSGIDVVDRCFEVLEHFPDAKFTLFVPTAYWRTMKTPGRPDTTTPRALYLREHPEFCDRLASLPRSNFEIGYHGRFHGIPNVSNNDELRSLDRRRCEMLWCEMQRDIELANLGSLFTQTIRPPAMYMSPAAIQFFADLDMTLALSPRDVHMRSYGSAAADNIDKVVFANAWAPDDEFSNLPQVDNIEILYHACTWDGGYFDTAKVTTLLKWLEQHPVEFSFINGMRRKQS